MEITQVLYWSMIESGLALVAACLPTLRFLFGNFSPESLIRSIRSVMSLESLRSQRSEDSRHVRLSDQDSTSTSSHTQLAKGEEVGATEIYAMADLEAQKSMPHSQIMVKSDIVQVENSADALRDTFK